MNGKPAGAANSHHAFAARKFTRWTFKGMSQPQSPPGGREYTHTCHHWHSNVGLFDTSTLRTCLVPRLASRRAWIKNVRSTHLSKILAMRIAYRSEDRTTMGRQPLYGGTC